MRHLMLPRLWIAVLLALCALLPVRAAEAVDRAQTKRLHAMFETRWDELMKSNPEWATYVGDNRHGDRLEDASPEAIAASYAATRRALAKARAFDRRGLSALDRTSLEVFIDQHEDWLRFEPFVGFRSMSLGALDGFQSHFAALLEASPVNKREQVEQVLARMAAYPKRVEQELALLREGKALGWVPPRSVLERVLPQIDGQLVADVDKSPFFEPFTRLGKDVPAAEQEALRERARQAIRTQVEPAMRRLRAFVERDYLPAAAASGALSTYPGGAAVYAAKMRSNITLDLTAEQVHAIGLREMKRLRGEMETVMREMKFDGDFAAFVAHLNTDPKYFHSSPEALLTGYRDIAKRLDAELPRLFANLPRATYGVRAMPAHFSSDRAEYYNGPPLDGSRPGWFYANGKAYAKRPIWGMESLVAHETVPGHHLQVARAIELGDLPRFRRFSGNYTAYIEGWALYAETLGLDLGLYTDPASRFGYLQMQALRAARLVVDTGMHALGWSRQQAIDYMLDQVGEQLPYVTSEVDRYLSDPGQALAYMIGELKIIELRDRAKARLGERFDIRAFHGVVLDQGAVPLPVLERAVDNWLAGEARRAR